MARRPLEAGRSSVMSAEQTGPDRRSSTDDRRGTEDRRATAGRRATDTEGRFALVPAAWATVGALVVVYLFFVALGSVKPSDAPVATAIALVLAVLWLGHAWRRVLVGSRSPVGDRERRGF
jgi:hypothetical protein